MSTLDPAKLKVVELRVELTNRGLDAKGNKPVLVKRLKEALEKELEKEIPDTSIADTSTEELNTSQESEDEDGKSVPPDKEPESPTLAEKESSDPLAEEEVEDPDEQPPVEPDKPDASTSESPVVESKLQAEEEDKIEESKDEDEPMSTIEENGENVDHEMQEDDKSDKVETAESGAEGAEVKAPEEPKGEKRRRSSPSPERVQRRRSKTPIKEDEPVLDNNKVQLSWYDSDLHLQVDKKSFLSGKPYHEGAFGYAWAGVRATHGAKAGKICFEVKITEELKWDELVKQQSEKKRDGHRSEGGSRRDRQRGGDKDKEKGSRDSPQREESIKTDGEKEKSENGDEEAEQKTTTEEKTEEPASEEPEQKAEVVEKPEADEQGSDGDKKEETTAETAEVKADEPMEVQAEEKKDEDVKDEEVKDEEAKDEEEKDEEVKDEEVKDEAEKAEEVKDEAEEVKAETMEVDETPADPIAKHLFRVGWSTTDAGLQLGEAKYSYGYESSAKFVANKEFVDYGVKFGVGDVIGAYLDIGDESVRLTFTVNGEEQPEATSIPRADLPEEDFVLFPHVLTRNYGFELNSGGQEEPWFAHPSELADYVYLETVEDKVQGPVRPEARSECEVIMMCGLPGSGKTHWVREMMKDNPDKRYTVIGNSHLLEKMTVNGNPLKNCYKGRWNVVLDRLMKCVNVLVEAAALRRRNFVIDQTNVFPSAQRRKMRLFEGFKRRAVVVVVADEEQAKRRTQQEAQDGKDVPDSAILEMKANMSLPRRGEWLEEVSYVELGEEEAKALIQKYNQQGREAGFGPIGQRGGYRDARGHPYRWDHSTSRRDYRGGYRDNRSYQNNRYDRPRQHGGWQNRRPPPGSWNRDIRRDSRGPPGGGSRDFRNNNRSSAGSGGRQERSGSRDNRNRNQSSGNFARNPRPQSNRNQAANWQGGSGGGGGGGGGSSGSWQNQNWGGGGQGMWNQGNWSQGGWGGGQAQQWKGSYGGQGGYGQGGYGNYANWNYYGQYAQQNWNSQGQPQTTTAASGGQAATDSANAAAYGQYSQQAAWAQYAQQYAQGQASTAQQQQLQLPPSTQK